MSSQDFQGFDHFLRGMHPAMNPATTLQGEHWRIGLITESLIRLEWSDSGEFEDRATLMAVDRAFLPSGAVDYTTGERDGMLVVETPALRLTYDRKPFSKEGLTIVVKGVPDSQFNTWHYGDDPKGNLGGTARTLDEADGAIPLGQGVISRDGWAVLDDSASNVFVTADADGNLPDGVVAYGGIGVAPRDHRETDIYFFGYGRRYREAVHDFQKLSGPAPLLPRYALGNWWSRYYRYSEEEYLDLMDRFKREGIPFTTSVIDMDWHLVDDVDPKYGSGWTGYTWNPKLFPDPKRFLDGLHERGLRTTVNIHPRDGIRAFEKPYAKAAATVGVDAEAQEPVEFDLTNPKFVQAYFDMHHDLEADGIDFWWIDWQQGGVTRQPGLDPLWVLNHMHYCDSARDGRWPLTFSRFAGPGSQRYPVGFSGDTVITWKSLKFQPYFTSTASNIGYGWWSHDIGGHMFGYRDEELEARWYQLGVFSPINRLHSSCSPFSGKEPWNFHEPVRSAMVDVLRLRQALMPYLYTMNWRAAVDGDPIVEPMYWANPNLGESYEVPDEFRFGTELVVAPVVDPMDKASMRGRCLAAAGRLVRFLRRSPLYGCRSGGPPPGGVAHDRPDSGVREGRRHRADAVRPAFGYDCEPACVGCCGLPRCGRLVRHARGLRRVPRCVRRRRCGAGSRYGRDRHDLAVGRWALPAVRHRSADRQHVGGAGAARLDPDLPRRGPFGHAGDRRWRSLGQGPGRHHGGGLRCGDDEPEREAGRRALLVADPGAVPAGACPGRIPDRGGLRTHPV